MIHYRPAEAEDLPQIYEMNVRYFSESWSRQALSDMLADPTMLCISAQAQNGGIVGYAALYQVLDEGNITQVAVREEERGKRIGTALLAELLKQAKLRGIRLVTLEVRASNAAAIALYQAAGFERQGVRKNYYKNPNEDGIIMNIML